MTSFSKEIQTIESRTVIESNKLPKIRRNNISTYKTIFRNIDQLVVGTIHMGNLGDKRTQKNVIKIK